MSCCGKQGGNVTTPTNTLYQQIFPERNAVWWTPIPDSCTRQRSKECCQRKLYTPNRQNSCASTFEPNSRPDPYQCLSLCQGKNMLKVNACQAQQMEYPRRISTNGCLMEPSVAEYTSAPMNNFCLKGDCKSESILTNSKRNPPNPPEYGYKESNRYDPLNYVFGSSYLY